MTSESNETRNGFRIEQKTTRRAQTGKSHRNSMSLHPRLRRSGFKQGFVPVAWRVIERVQREMGQGQRKLKP